MALDGPRPTLRALEEDYGITLYCRRDPGCNLGTGVQSLDIWTHTDATPFPAPMVAHESTTVFKRRGAGPCTLAPPTP